MPALEFTATHHQEQRLWPGLVALARILALPAAELEDAVEHQLAENPALDRDRAGDCAASCAWCRDPAGAPAPDGPRELAAPPHDELVADARLLVGPTQVHLVEHLVACLDDRGLLGATPAELAEQTGASPQDVRDVVAALRVAGPPWTAARDLREALLLQLDALGDEAPELPRRLVADHLGALATGAFGRAARALGATRGEVVAARDFIRARLEAPTSTVANGAVASACRPDVVVLETAAGGLDVDLPGARHLRVRVDPGWRELARGGAGSPADRALATELVGRAETFADRLEDRRRTLLEVARHTVERQARYARGERPPAPLTRAAVARAVGVHESTVSRAVAGKLVQLPGGRPVAFASFFHASRGAEEALAEVVATEARPLSDAELACALGRLGFPVARRTVTKYRTRLGIASHAVR